MNWRQVEDVGNHVQGRPGTPLRTASLRLRTMQASIELVHDHRPRGAQTWSLYLVIPGNIHRSCCPCWHLIIWPSRPSVGIFEFITAKPEVHRQRIIYLSTPPVLGHCSNKCIHSFNNGGVYVISECSYKVPKYAFRG